MSYSQKKATLRVQADDYRPEVLVQVVEAVGYRAEVLS